MVVQEFRDLVAGDVPQVFLICNATSCNPAPKSYTWYFNYSKTDISGVESKYNAEDGGRKLVVKHFSELDLGVYSCLAHNGGNDPVCVEPCIIESVPEIESKPTTSYQTSNILLCSLFCYLL